MKLSCFIFLLFLIASCDDGYELSEIYGQAIKNSSKTIIEYQAWSKWNDGAKCGTTLLKIGNSVEVGNADKLPFRFFLGNPTKDTLFVIDFIESKSKIPTFISTEISKFNGMIVKTDNYAYSIYNSLNLSYKFSSFRETKDSLIISSIEKDYFNLPTEKNELGFLKGNIKLVESDSAQGIVERIEIPSFLLRKFNNNSIDKITTIRNAGLKVDGLVFFTFLPTKQIKTIDFTNFGIYKKRAIKNKKTIQID